MSWLPPVLPGERIVLRPMAEADLETIFANCSNPRLTEYTAFETHASRQVSEDFLRGYCFPNYEQQIADPLAIALKDAPETLIGCTGGKWTETRCNRAIEFGYWIGEPWWGHGFATEAVKLLVPYLFDHYRPVRVQAHAMAANLASARVLEKAGLHYEGTIRRAIYRRGHFHDVKLYSILAEEVGNLDKTKVQGSPALPAGELS